jgi:hypothetical protein
VTGIRAKSAPAAGKNTVLFDFQTQYGVLAGQLSHYEQKLAACPQSREAACAKSFADNAEHQFGSFADDLMNDAFPARVSGDVAKLSATARHLNLLFDEIRTGDETADTSTEIENSLTAMSRQYVSLVKALSSFDVPSIAREDAADDDPGEDGDDCSDDVPD